MFRHMMFRQMMSGPRSLLFFQDHTRRMCTLLLFSLSLSPSLSPSLPFSLFFQNDKSRMSICLHMQKGSVRVHHARSLSLLFSHSHTLSRFLFPSLALISLMHTYRAIARARARSLSLSLLRVRSLLYCVCAMVLLLRVARWSRALADTAPLPCEGPFTHTHMGFI
jgi:hypothetical protein